MNPAGELRIDLARGPDGPRCRIVSTRPLAAARLFTGKPVEQVLQTVPLLFNVCARAQAASLVRAIESLSERYEDEAVASRRQAVVLLESLREQTLRILLDWPEICADTGGSMQKNVTALVRATVGLGQTFDPQRLFLVGGGGAAVDEGQRKQWRALRQRVETVLFGMPATQWLARHGESRHGLAIWAAARKSVAARFLLWLSLQPWRDAGASPIVPPAALDDAVLARRLRHGDETFTHRPDWRGTAIDMSWFGTVVRQPLVQQLSKRHGNGIYTRCAARLVAIAQTVIRLDAFFQRQGPLRPLSCHVPGMAHTEAARGRLTHQVVLDGERVERLRILAPTEWNFHPRGVAATGLENLHDGDETLLRLQARLLIHAIDPCVGYRLNIGGTHAPVGRVVAGQ